MVRKLFLVATVVAVTYTSGCFVQMSRGQLCFVILFRIPLKCSIHLTSKELALPFLFYLLRRRRLGRLRHYQDQERRSTRSERPYAPNCYQDLICTCVVFC